MTQSILTKYQKKTVSKLFTENKVQKRITVELGYEGECNNGHNSFTLTVEIRQKDRRIRDCEAYGCLHDEVAEHFPELRKYIKWHLFNSDRSSPYIESTLWHARDSEHPTLPGGSPLSYKTVLTFGDNPIQHSFNRDFMNFLSNIDFKTLEIRPIKHKPNTISFDPKFTFRGYADQWHQCPFDSELDAKNFLYALQNCNPKLTNVPVSFVKSKPRDLDAARRCAIWPEATDDELTSPNLRQLLEARLPKLLEEFQADMQELGFTF